MEHGHNVYAMTKNALAKMDMFAQVRKTIQENSPIWEGFGKFTTAFNQFTSIHDALIEKAYTSGNATVGVSEQVKLTRGKTTEIALEIAAIIKAFASENDLADLKEQMHIVKSGLNFGKKSETIHLIKRIHEKAVTHFDALTEYGLTTEKLDDFTLLKDELENAFDKTRKAINTGKTIRLSLKNDLIQMNRLLKDRIDPLVFSMKKDHIEFFNAYQNARNIIEPKTTKSKGVDFPPESEGDPF